VATVHSKRSALLEQEELDQQEAKDPYYSRAAGKTLELLQILDQAAAPASLAMAAAAVGLNKTSAFRLLYTLEKLHYIERDEAGNYLRASQKPKAELNLPHLLTEAAAEPMRKLSMEFRETISLSHLCSNHIEVLAVLDSPHLMRMANVVGRILPPHASSMGKAITAHQTPELRTRLLTSYGFTCYTPRTISDECQLEECFQQIRAGGLAFDDEENTPGGFCLGVPIFWPDQTVQAALSLSMPKSRLSPEEKGVQLIMDELRAASAEVTSRLEASKH